MSGKGSRNYTGVSGKMSDHWRPNWFYKQILRVIWLETLATCSNISQHEQRTLKMAWSLQYFLDLGWAEEEIRRPGWGQLGGACVSVRKGFSWRILSACGTQQMPLTSRGARRWILFRWFISAFCSGCWFPLRIQDVATLYHYRLH